MNIETIKPQEYSYLVNGTMLVPNDPANRHYQLVLDAIIEQGADCFEGDIPEDLQAAADAKQAEAEAEVTESVEAPAETDI